MLYHFESSANRMEAAKSMFFDFSHNGSFADEAAVITAAGGILFGLIKVWQSTHKTAKKIDVVVETLNNVDGTPMTSGETSMGYRIVRIEQQVDSVQKTLNNLAGAMTEHIQWEEKKSSRIERRLDKVEETLVEVRDCMEKHHPNDDPPPPAPKTRRPRK